MKTVPKIKLSQVAVVLQALAGLDGSMKIVKGADGAETSVFQAFEFTRKVTWNKVKNIGLLKRKLEDLETLRNELRKKHGAVGQGEVPVDKRTAFFAEYTEAMKLEEELKGALMFTEEDLNIYDPKENQSGNKIPSTVLEALAPFITEK